MTLTEIQVKVKICGLTSRRDVLHAVRFGADAVGFIFYKKSPRAVSEKTVKSFISLLPPFMSRVGVFANESVERVNRIVESCGLDYVQLHGDETASYCKKINCKVIKAVRITDVKMLRKLAPFRGHTFLVDASSEDKLGGTGELCDWNLARRVKKYGPVILAGGLKPVNVVNAILRVEPCAVDVCSGVEKTPGRKDSAKVEAFINAVKTGVSARVMSAMVIRRFP